MKSTYLEANIHPKIQLELIIKGNKEPIKLFITQISLNNCKICQYSSIEGLLANIKAGAYEDVTILDFIDVLVEHSNKESFYFNISSNHLHNEISVHPKLYKVVKLPLGYSGKFQYWYFFQGNKNSYKERMMNERKANVDGLINLSKLKKVISKVDNNYLEFGVTYYYKNETPLYYILEFGSEKKKSLKSNFV